MRLRVVLLAGFLLVAAGWAALPGQSVPDFRLADATGKVVTLKDLKGKPAVVTFWATWCNVCKSELPRLHALAKEFKLNYYTLSPSDTTEAALEYMKQFPAFVPLVALKGGDTPRTVEARWQVFGQPVTFVLDAEGKVVARFVGRVELASFKDALELAGVQL